MLDAAQDALGFVQDRTRLDLDRDRLLALGLVKSIEIIGEAANQVSTETQARFPVLPWRNIIAMRHRTVHGYADIDYDVVWRTVTDRLPTLVVELAGAVSTLEQEQG